MVFADMQWLFNFTQVSELWPMGFLFLYLLGCKYMYLLEEPPSDVSNEYSCLFVLRFYGPVNPMGSCRARSVYLTTCLLGRLSPLSG